MEMISPQSYKTNVENKTIDELLLEQKNLLEKISSLEKMDTSTFLSDTRLDMNKLYLNEVNKLIVEKGIKYVVDKIKELQKNTETSITSLLGSDSLSKYNGDILTKIFDGVCEECEKENIILDFSKYANQKIGLIFNIPFIIKGRNSKFEFRLFKKKKLKRKDIAKFYGYHSKNNINDKETAINYLNEITNYLNKYSYESNNDFLMLGRKKFVYDEVMDILNGNKKVDDPIYFVLGSLEEFICNNNQVYFSDVDKSKLKNGNIIDGKDYVEIRNKNDNYIKYGYICLEEKEYIISMIKAIKERID